MHKSLNRFAIVALILAGMSAMPRVSHAQEELAGKGNPRDVAAADEALKGWWTEALKTRDERLEWWRDARFGCFIHWGVYAGPAGEWDGRATGSYSEHIMRQARIPLTVYKEKVVAPFDPEKFNADEWIKLIKGAGMRYICVTAKHHDGFAMWPSDVYKYDIRDNTKFKRDPMAELADACHRNGIHLGFYYSHAFDWEHPDAPGNDWDYQNPAGDKQLFGKDWADTHPELVTRVQHYVDEKAIPQLRELISKYHPDIFWFDVSGKLPFSEQIRIVKAVREADPNVVINGRAARGLGHNFGDYQDTADNPAEVRPTAGDWENIPTVNHSYGYNKRDNDYKTPEFLIRLMVKTAAKGGNTLLNIGPMADGTIDPHATSILQGIGKWMDVNGDSIHGTTRTPLDRQAWGDSTVKDNTIYLHAFDWPSDGRLIIGGLQSNVTDAHLLSDPEKKPLKAERLNDNDVVVGVPMQAPDLTDSVVVLTVDGEVRVHPGRLLDSRGINNRLLAFDGETHGKFVYGDGKAPTYYVGTFSHPDDAISWKTRLNGPAVFDVSIKYSTTSAESSGNYQIKFDDQTLEGQIIPTTSAKEARTVKVGRISMQAGEHEIRIQRAQTSTGDLMDLFEINLTPAAKEAGH